MKKKQRKTGASHKQRSKQLQFNTAYYWFSRTDISSQGVFSAWSAGLTISSRDVPSMGSTGLIKQSIIGSQELT